MRDFFPNPAQQVPFEIKNFAKIEPQVLAARYGFTIGKILSYSIPKPFLPENLDAKSTMNEGGATSYLGTPVGNRFIQLFDGSTGERDTTILSPVITVRYSKNIVRTPITGFDYTIKEIVSGNDYQIDIVGIFATQYAWDYPIQEVTNLNDLLKTKSVIEINNEYLTDCYNITKFIPESWEFSFHPTLTNLIMLKITGYGE